MTELATATLPIGSGTSQFGGKGGEGVWQTIINQIPPHELFVEAFAGSAVITLRKRLAASTIVIDADAAVCRSVRGKLADAAGCIVICADAISWLEVNRHTFAADRTVVYCDPPYLFDVRDCGRQIRQS